MMMVGKEKMKIIMTTMITMRVRRMRRMISMMTGVRRMERRVPAAAAGRERKGYLISSEIVLASSLFFRAAILPKG
jgi:hypothetical protein